MRRVARSRARHRAPPSLLDLHVELTESVRGEQSLRLHHAMLLDQAARADAVRQCRLERADLLLVQYLSRNSEAQSRKRTQAREECLGKT